MFIVAVLLRLLLLLILLPLADLILLIMLLKTHWPATLVWIVVTALFGIWFIRRQGTHVLTQMREMLGRNKLPTDVLIEAFMAAFAGFLLMLPGLITDLIGISLLLRPSRRWYRRRLIAWLNQRVQTATFTTGPGGTRSADVVDAKVVGRRRPESADEHDSQSSRADTTGIAR